MSAQPEAVIGGSTASPRTVTSRRNRASRPRGAATFDDLVSMAETMYVERGYEGLSMRGLADAAGINLGSIYYYCKSKEDLIRLALERRIGPILVERMRRFKAIEADPPADAGDAVRAVLHAFIEPALVISAETHEEGMRTRSLHARIHGDPAPAVVHIVYDLYAEVGQTCLRLLRRFTPHLREEEFLWRSIAVLGTARAATPREPWLTLQAGGAFKGENSAEGVRQLVQALHAGMMAPSLQADDK